jgi:hypothetical protein
VNHEVRVIDGVMTVGASTTVKTVQAA